MKLSLRFINFNILKKNLAYQPAKNLRYNIHFFDIMLIFAN